MTKRLIVSGCSYTNYLKPTWVDFLSEQFDETYNFGKAGAGNEYIFHSLVEADRLLKFTPDDVIIVVWSGYSRLDRSSEDEFWVCKGDMSHYSLDDFDYLSKHFTEQFLLKKTMNYISQTYNYFKEKKLNFAFSSIYNIKENNPFFSCIEECFNDKFLFKSGITDGILKKIPREGWGHPTARDHYIIAKIFGTKFNVVLNTKFDFEKFMKFAGTEENYAKLYRNIFEKIYFLENISAEYNQAYKQYPSALTKFEKIIDDFI